ncbi:hypothetical protein KJ654_01680 [Patescibacteria group bacterium]|nr:hypothetical protein [Patescibacteria group bacterium]
MNELFQRFLKKKPMSEPPQADWEYTQDAKRYAEQQRAKQQLHPADGQQGAEVQEILFKGRHIIGRDTPINKGVYFVGGVDEATVVDDEKDRHLLLIYHQLLNWMRETQNQGSKYKTGILKKVWALAMKTIPYKEARTDQIVNKVGIDRKIYLSAFFGGGVCRHQALLAGYLLEKLINDDYLQGKVSVDRNSLPGKNGHAWVRYTNSRGIVFILDPTNKYKDRLENASNKKPWRYERPSDRIHRKSPHIKLTTRIRQLFLAQPS